MERGTLLKCMTMGILIFVAFVSLWSEEGYFENLPLQYSSTVTPDISPYADRQVITVDYSVRLDTTWSDSHWKGRDYVIVFSDDIGSVVANDMNMTFLSHTNSRHLRINEENPHVSGQMTFQLNGARAGFFFTVQAFRITDDPGASANIIDIGSTECYDMAGMMLIRSEAWRKEPIKFSPAPRNLPQVRPDDLESTNRDPGEHERGILRGSTITIQFDDDTEVDNPLLIEEEYEGEEFEEIGSIVRWTDSSVTLAVSFLEDHVGHLGRLLPDESIENVYMNLEIVNEYPLRGKVQFEEHSPFGQDEPFFLSPQYLDWSSPNFTPSKGIALL